MASSRPRGSTTASRDGPGIGDGGAGVLHDIGNVVNRRGHPNSGAVMSMPILQRLGMPMDDIAVVMGAIGSHGDDGGGLAEPVHAVSSAR